MDDGSPISTRVVNFLTPFKTAVIMLCMMYCEDLILLENKVELMAGVVKFIDGDGDHGNYSEVGTGLSLLETKLKNYKVGGSQLSVYSFLVDKLWQVESLDDLYNFFDGIERYIMSEKPEDDEEEEDEEDEFPSVMKVTPSSLLGNFFRKCILSFKQLNFDQTAELWRAYRTFRSREPREEVVNPEDTIPEVVLEQEPLEYIASENLNNLMEHYASLFASQGAVLPESVKAKLQQLIDSEQYLPSSAYFVQYLEACHKREYEIAFEYLHRFYDYSMDRRGRTHYQYALFTLAILQAEFGSINESLRAAQEAIAVARENLDHPCLTQILSWLYTYMQNHPEVDLPASFASLDQIAHFLQTRSDETSHHLYSLSCQCEAIRSMSRGESLTNVFENLIKSLYMNLKYSAGTDGDLFLVKSSVWGRCGNSTLANMYMDISTNTKDQKLGTNLQANTRKARLLFSQGHVGEAFGIMDRLREHSDRSFAYEHVWLPPSLVLHVKRCLNGNKLQEARVLLENLRSFQCDVELQHEIQCLEIMLDMALGNHAKAVSRAYDCAQNAANDKADIMYHIQYMLLYVRGVCESSPCRAFSSAVRAFTLAERATILPLALEALILLAQILNARHNFYDAVSILDHVMPRVYETGHVGLIGEAYETLSRAMGDAPRLSASYDRAMKAYAYNTRAIQYYEKEGNLAKTSRVYGYQERLLPIVQKFGLTRRSKLTKEITTQVKQRMKINAMSSVLCTE